MTTGEKIQKLRQEKNWSQERLAQELNLSRQSISKWESGTATPTVENLMELSKIFNVSVDSILANEENQADNIKEDKTKDNKTKMDRKFLIISGAVIAVLIVAIISLIVSQVYIYKHLEQMQASINRLEQTQATINSIDRTVYVDSNNYQNQTQSLFTNWSVKPIKYYDNKTMDVLISVLPKNNMTGTKAEFGITGIEDNIKSVSAELSGQEYTATVNMPWNVNPSINVSLIHEDGTIENEVLPYYELQTDMYYVNIEPYTESGWSTILSANITFQKVHDADEIKTDNLLSGKPVLVDWEIKQSGKTIKSGNLDIYADENDNYEYQQRTLEDTRLESHPKDISIVLNITDENGIKTTITQNVE